MPHKSATEKESSAHTAHSELSGEINATTFRRYSTLLAIKLLKRFGKRTGTVLHLSKKICVKYGEIVTLNDAASMQFVAKHTSVPVPRVYCAFEHAGRRYIVMERLKGKNIASGWYLRSEESRNKILSQLKDMVGEIRRIPPPPGTGVAHANGGPLSDPRLPSVNSDYFGPFRTFQDFHKYLRRGMEVPPKDMPEVGEFIAQQDSIQPPPVFTHGDLSSLNVIASGDKIIGIIDWETAGWYPAYWEYTNAWNANPQNAFWQDEVDKFLQPMPKELEMEKLRLKWFGDY
ncbi:kinase subdomain-containing [Pyrenophora seminiperda CCB06]|uniref:Kinase subdomain-containing n=1 Tax=Pyrenophora seminiperda CCB06 TaxID=1302712 RepID=A0A3M7LZP8_9PLEO|nr:kinase subdomain-containing [Pyrenophora seminiperda CCB06]